MYLSLPLDLSAGGQHFFYFSSRSLFRNRNSNPTVKLSCKLTRPIQNQSVENAGVTFVNEAYKRNEFEKINRQLYMTN